MNRTLMVAACAMVLVLLATAQKSAAQKGGGSTTSNLPVVNSLSPNSTEAGMGSFVMTVSGSNFTTGSVVRWNGSNVSTGYISSTQLNATVASSLIASTGTANITVFTSGRKGGTSNTLTFTIATPTTTAPAPAPAPAPSPTKLTITTTSLPGSTAGTPLSATVAATGGAPAYGWSMVNGGGSLPPGLTLQATGTISGTPTQSGTFTFTTQANDSASQIAQKVLSITVAADPNATTTTTSSTAPLFQTGFESTDPTFDGGISAPYTMITSTPPPGRSGNALQTHYTICGATDGTCGASSQDINRWVSKVISPAQTHVFMRGYVYFKTPEPDATATTYAQRKIMWFSDSTSASNSQVNYANFIVGWSAVGRNTLSLMLGGNNVAACAAGANATIWDMAFLNWNTWYSIEVEIQLNTPGASDGIFRLWVNGVQAYSNTAYNFRGTCPDPIGFFSVGRQANRFNYDVIDEYRYWDDVVISNSYIGP